MEASPSKVEWTEKGLAMITFRFTADVADDHRIVLTLPPEVPTGQAQLVVTVESPASGKEPPRMGLPTGRRCRRAAKGAEQPRYPLRASVVSNEQATEPVAEGDWEGRLTRVTGRMMETHDDETMPDL